MCEAAVFLDKDGDLEKVMDDVVEVRPFLYADSQSTSWCGFGAGMVR